jgi:hypothetical protein
MSFSLTLSFPDFLIIIAAQLLIGSVGFLLVWWKRSYLFGYLVGALFSQHQDQLVAIGQKVMAAFIQKQQKGGSLPQGGDLGDMVKQMFMQWAMSKGQEMLTKGAPGQSGSNVWKTG